MTGEIGRAAIALYDRFTHEGMDRRDFMARLTRLAGSAAAAQLLLAGIAADAQARPLVAADDRRLRTRELGWEPRAGRRYRGYEAAPARARANLPAILVVHENRGLNEHIRDIARRLAVAGYTALAMDFLSPAGGTPAGEDEARAMIGRLDMAETVADGAATIRWLGARGARRRRVGVVGFCWGGAMVHRLAVASGRDLGAGVAFYGPAPQPAEAPRVEAPLLLHLAGLDTRVNATARPWAEALRAAGKAVSVLDYAGVDHAFHNDTSAARYDRGAALRAWAATLDFFRQHLR